MNDYDYCDECSIYGDNYSYDPDTNSLICNCYDCPNNPDRYDDEGRLKDETD